MIKVNLCPYKFILVVTMPLNMPRDSLSNFLYSGFVLMSALLVSYAGLHKILFSYWPMQSEKPGVMLDATPPGP